MSLNETTQIKDNLSNVARSLSKSPPDLPAFKTFVEDIRDLSWNGRDPELKYMSFILDGLLNHLMAHVSGEASLIIKQSDAKKLVSSVASHLSLIAEAMGSGDVAVLYKSYVSLVADYLTEVKEIRVD